MLNFTREDRDYWQHSQQIFVLCSIRYKELFETFFLFKPFHTEFAKHDRFTLFASLHYKDSLMCDKALTTKSRSRLTLRKHSHAIYRKCFGCKNENFTGKKLIFIIFMLNIDRRGGSNEYPPSSFCAKNKKNRYIPAYSSFTI